MAPSRAVNLFSPTAICAKCMRKQIRHTWVIRQTRWYASESHLPRVAQTSFWKSLVPTFLRRTPSGTAFSPPTVRKEWNPATIFIVLSVLIGSNSIQIITLKREMLNFSRKTEAKLSLLREVVQRVKDGEDVDVKKVLGTGNPQSEAEWEEVMKELESTDGLWESKLKEEQKRAANAQREKEKEAMRAATRARGADLDAGAQEEAKDRRKARFMM